jgi:hypothetical protein
MTQDANRTLKSWTVPVAGCQRRARDSSLGERLYMSPDGGKLVKGAAVSVAPPGGQLEKRLNA